MAETIVSKLEHSFAAVVMQEFESFNISVLLMNLDFSAPDLIISAPIKYKNFNLMGWEIRGDL